MQNALNKFEKVVSYVLLIAVMSYIAFQSIELIWEAGKSYAERIHDVGLDYTQDYGKDIFIIFFNILLALEILETVRVFDKDHDIKIRIILLVCIIAISRKILTIDVHQSRPLDEMAMAVLILCLSFSYFLIYKSTADKNHEQKNIDNTHSKT